MKKFTFCKLRTLISIPCDDTNQTFFWLLPQASCLKIKAICVLQAIVYGGSCLIQIDSGEALYNMWATSLMCTTTNFYVPRGIVQPIYPLMLCNIWFKATFILNFSKSFLRFCHLPGQLLSQFMCTEQSRDFMWSWAPYSIYMK